MSSYFYKRFRNNWSPVIGELPILANKQDQPQEEQSEIQNKEDQENVNKQEVAEK